MQTVVGVFDTVDDAQNARDALLDSGFDASEVRLQSNSAAQDSDTLTTTDRTISGTSRSSTENEGFMAGIGRFFGDLFGSNDNEQAGNYSEAVRRGSTVVAVTVSDPGRVEQARSTLAAAGAVDIDKRTESWRQEGYEGFDPSAQPYQPDQVAAERSRYQSAGTRSSDDLLTPNDTRVDHVDQGTVLPVEEQVQLREERADIERRAVDRPATEADLKAFEGGSIEIHETSERPVASTRTETVSEQVRNTVVDVDKSGDGTPGTAGPDYRSHYAANRASLDGAYEDYEPAYQYGSSLRSDPRYANRSWDEVEADARNDWSNRYPTGASTWEQTKQAVRHGWESMTGRR